MRNVVAWLFISLDGVALRAYPNNSEGCGNEATIVDFTPQRTTILRTSQFSTLLMKSKQDVVLAYGDERQQ